MVSEERYFYCYTLFNMQELTADISIPSRVYTFVLIGLIWEVFILIFWIVGASRLV